MDKYQRQIKNIVEDMRVMADIMPDNHNFLASLLWGIVDGIGEHMSESDFANMCIGAYRDQIK